MRTYSIHPGTEPDEKLVVVASSHAGPSVVTSRSEMFRGFAAFMSRSSIPTSPTESDEMDAVIDEAVSHARHHRA